MAEEEQIKSVMIIGGGIGGLALAHYLKNNPKIKVQIFERDSALKSRSQGYQIGINEDGVGVLRSLNIPGLEELLSLNDKDGFKIVDSNFNLLFHVKMGVRGGGLVNRWKLRELLTQGLDIQWGKKFVKYEEFADHVVAHFEDGTTAKADLLVGVDGAKSRVRAQRCPELLYEPVGIIGGAGFVPMPSRELAPKMVELSETSMVRALTRTSVTLLFFTFKNYEDEKFMCWTISRNKNSPDENIPEDKQQFKDMLLAMASNIHPEIYKLVEMTPEETMLPAVNMYAIKVPAKKDIMGKTGRVVLMGDAAHAMTTHAGLGANTALMDARDLAEALSSENGSWRSRLAQYEKKMCERGWKNINTSLTSTRMLHMGGSVAPAIRDWFVWTMGCIMSLKQKIIG